MAFSVKRGSARRHSIAFPLVRSCNEQAIDLTQSGVMLTQVAQELALVASVPLTDEPWEPISAGEFVALTQGLVQTRKPASLATVF